MRLVARRSAFLAWCASAVVAFGLLGEQPAEAHTGLGCGATIVADTTLVSDLSNCHSVGLIIGADGVTLDLGGHTIDGDGVRDVEGIRVVGRHHVVIENGTISDFVEGVVLRHARATRLSHLRLSGHRHVGVFTSASRDVTIEHTRSRDIAFSALFALRSRNVRIADNNVTASGGGVFLDTVTGMIVTGNRVADSREGIAVQAGDGGRIVGNRVSHSSDADGVFLGAGSTGLVVSRNVVVGNTGGVGLADGAHGNLISHNLALGNAFVGVYLFGADANRVEHNLILHNGDGSEGGIHVLSNDAGTPSNRNLVYGNLIIGNAGDGILVDRGQTHTLVLANRAFTSTDDGIDVNSSATTIAGNTANANHDLGIEAAAGAVDGGANSAHGNGDRRECVNVRC